MSRRWRERSRTRCTSRRAHLRGGHRVAVRRLDEDLDVAAGDADGDDPEAYAHALSRRGACRRTWPAASGCRGGRRGRSSAARCCTIRKLAMPDAVLRKPAPLTARGAAAHSSLSADWLRADRGRALPRVAAPLWFGDAHERLDGLGLSGRRRAATRSALGARIVAVADAFDTMTRAAGLPRRDHARRRRSRELERCSGTQFDPGRRRVSCRPSIRTDADSVASRKLTSRLRCQLRSILSVCPQSTEFGVVYGLIHEGRAWRRRSGHGSRTARHHQRRARVLEPERAGALRGSGAPPRSAHLGRRPAGLPHRAAHRPLAERQVHRPRAVERGHGLVEQGQPADRRRSTSTRCTSGC